MIQRLAMAMCGLRRSAGIVARAALVCSVAALPMTPLVAEAQPRNASQQAKKTASPAKAAKPRIQKNAEPARRAVEARGDGFKSGDRWVRMDVIKADPDLLGSAGRAPAVLILHGSLGLGDGSLFYPQARALADRGITAFVVHYFDGLSEARKAAPNLHDRREKVIADAISHVSSLNFVDPERIGVFGLSLGGFHALSLGVRDQRVQAVVNMFGAMPAEVQRKGVERMPPTLILHGDRDRIIPVRKAHELASLLKDVGAEHEMKIYSGEGHAFRGAAKEDSISRTVDFFERYLGIDKGLLDKPVEFEIALAPVVPEAETLPIRALTLADELAQMGATDAEATAPAPAMTQTVEAPESVPEREVLSVMAEDTPIN